MIHDKFTRLAGKLSRQRIHQLRKTANGICQICTQPSFDKTRCADHQMENTVSMLKWTRSKHGIPLDWPKHKRFKK